MKKHEELLNLCRLASTHEDQLKAWSELISFVPTAGLTVKEDVAQRVLLEWPYRQVSDLIDQLLDACGSIVGVSVCTGVLKQLSSSSLLTKLPLPSVLQACWTTLQRLLLRDEEAKQFTNDQMELIQLVKLLLLLPQIIANACHAVKVRVPISATSSQFYPRLVERAASNPIYLQALIQNMLASRKSDVVALGLANHHPFPQLARMDLSPRETAHLLLALLQLLVSSTPQNPKVLDTCLALLKSSSVEHREAFMQHVLFTTSKDQRVCPLVVRILDKSDLLYPHLCDIAETWCQWTFCHEVDSHQQHYITQFLLCGLATLKREETHDSDDLTLSLLHGVTHRLESSFPQIRFDGMRVAQQVAKRLGQELNFDELEEHEQDKENNTEELTVLKNKDEEVPDEPPKFRSKKKKPKKQQKQLDPDADYDSDETEDLEDDTDSASEEISWRDDDSTVFDDELVPYDLSDDEDDLTETPRPLHLLQALEMLRTPETDEHAHSHHETALQSLSDLIRKRPDDLPDVASSMAHQLLRMENKFNLNKFALLRHDSILALTTEEPVLVGQRLIEESFKEGGLLDRLQVFAALQEAAYELSGSKELDERQTAKTKRALEFSKKNPSEKTLPESRQVPQASAQLARIQTKTRRKRSPRSAPLVISNRFTSIAPIWFYSLVAGFAKNKDNESLWAGSAGSQFLANLFRTLAAIVEFSGIYSSQVLAKDLLEVVWSFRDADVAEIRLSVLVSVATSIAMLPEDKILAFLMDGGGAGIPQIMGDMSRTDPDSNCRSIALGISRSIVEAMKSIPGLML